MHVRLWGRKSVLALCTWMDECFLCFHCFFSFPLLPHHRLNTTTQWHGTNYQDCLIWVFCLLPLLHTRSNPSPDPAFSLQGQMGLVSPLSPHVMWDEGATAVWHKFPIETDGVRFQFLSSLLQSHSPFMPRLSPEVASVFKYPLFSDSCQRQMHFLPDIIVK